MKTQTPATAWRRGATFLLAAFAGALLASAQSPSTSSLSELLEKGVYSEETQGDLDAALKLYQQVVTEAKDSHALASQAQYRLGVVQYKKKNFPEAAAAFEKVIKDYPDEKEVTALARQYLATMNSLHPAPWTDGEELRLRISLGGKISIGCASYSVSAAETNGQKIWHLGARQSIGHQSFSRVQVDAETFQPIQSRWRHMLLGDVNAVYGPDRVELKTVGKEEKPKTLEIDSAVLDNEEVIQWMRRLPLASGYKTSARILTSLGGLIITLKFDVSGPEKVSVPAGTFDCYKVDLSINQTFWYSTDTNRYLVKFEGGGAVGELTAINHLTPGQPATYQDPSQKFSLSAPAQWLFDRQEQDDEKENEHTKILILDPEAIGISHFKTSTLDALESEEKKSVRNWAEQEVAETSKMFKDFKVRPDAWEERTIGGRAGASVIADYLFGKEKVVFYAIYFFDDKHARTFQAMVSQKDFETFRPQFDAVANAFKPSTSVK